MRVEGEDLVRLKDHFRGLDILVAMYITDTGNLPSEHTIMDLMKWASQTIRESEVPCSQN